jgi:tetratricopeptide (TPR) repeat protein
MQSNLPTQKARVHHSVFERQIRFWAASILLSVLPGFLEAQATAPTAQNPSAAPTATTTTADATRTKFVRSSDRRRAAKLFLAASKLYAESKFEEAMNDYDQAAKLDPSNKDYALSMEVARSHFVTALIQNSAKDRLRGDAAAARIQLAHALALDPTNLQVTQHLFELGDDALLMQPVPIYEQGASTAGEAVQLSHTAGVHSFHLHTSKPQIVQQVFKAYGIEATVDQSVAFSQGHFDVDDADFETAARLVGMMTSSFYVPLDPQRVLVVSSTPTNHQQFEHQQLETVYLSGLTDSELTEVGTVTKNIFEIPGAIVEPSSKTITLRASDKTLDAFNATIRQLIDGHSQVMLDVRLIQLAHTSSINTGIEPPQSMTAFNVYAQEQSILNSNQALVKQIISSGLASPGDTLAIIGILLASGQVSSSLFANGIALFGGGLTQSALSPGPAKVNFALNSSDSRQLDQIQLRLGDGEAGTLRTGSRYPIQTASFSSPLSNSAIAGLTGAGNSGSLSSLLGSLSSSAASVPQVQYQDLGLTLKATPKVMRDDNIALTLDLKIDALSGSSVNGNPILNSRTYSGVVTIKEGTAVVVASEVDKQESHAVSGAPGISEVPGMNDLTGKDNEKNYASLLIIITPHIVRGTQTVNHSPIMRVEKGTAMR